MLASNVILWHPRKVNWKCMNANTRAKSHSHVDSVIRSLLERVFEKSTKPVIRAIHCSPAWYAAKASLRRVNWRPMSGLMNHGKGFRKHLSALNVVIVWKQKPNMEFICGFIMAIFRIWVQFRNTRTFSITCIQVTSWKAIITQVWRCSKRTNWISFKGNCSSAIRSTMKDIWYQGRSWLGSNFFFRNHLSSL